MRFITKVLQQHHIHGGILMKLQKFVEFQSSAFRYYSSTGGGYLREAYYCNDAWTKRLQTPTLKNVVPDDLFFEIDKRYQADKVLSAIDVDIYLNSVIDTEVLDEIEEVVYRLRKSPATTDTLPSTSYALIRAFFKAKKTDDLMRILNDRMNYGIFVDFHMANILMDEFIKNENYRDAAKVASLLMLEEDFGSSTTKYFSLISCLKYLSDRKPEPWVVESEQESKEEKIRVKKLRNVYFDFHFDLHEQHHIVGKTLAMIGKLINEDPVLSRSAQLIGWAMYGKWDNVEIMLKNCINSKHSIYKESMKLVMDLLEKAEAEIESSPTKTLSKPKLKPFPGMNLYDKEVAEFFETIKYPDFAKILPTIKSSLLSSTLLIEQHDETLISISENLLSSALSEREDLEIKEQEKVYELWNEMRKEELKKQIRRFKAFEITQNIESKKKELKDKEDVIFFFDNEEEWMMKLPLEEQSGYRLPTTYVDQNSVKFVKVIPPKKIKKKSKVKV